MLLNLYSLAWHYKEELFGSIREGWACSRRIIKAEEKCRDGTGRLFEFSGQMAPAGKYDRNLCSEKRGGALK